MSKHINTYRITNPEEVDLVNFDEAMEYLKLKGKKNPMPYDNGKICFHHKGNYFFINTLTWSWCLRNKANRKWNRASSMDEVYNAIEEHGVSYMAYAKRKGWK